VKFNFFTPTSKVHKQRNVMRDTDSRLARYSKRGLALSILVFGLSMSLGDYYEQQPQLTIVFAIGILLSVSIRAYYLFFFDRIYARAPSHWRNLFFSVTLLSALWWGAMLAAVTFELGLTRETPLLWLYTITFFSSCSHVFSPYLRFYSLYTTITLLPCSLIAILSLEAINVVYGMVMLIFLVLLQRQGQGQGQAYWDRLQANYDLMQRANALEAEKITTESSLNQKDTLFSNVAAELKISLYEIMGSLQLLKLSNLPEKESQLATLAEKKLQQQLLILQNILEFSQISRNQLPIKEEVIDLRNTLEKTLVVISDHVYGKGIELLTRFSQGFPMTVRGDSERIAQALKNIVSSAADYADGGEMLLDVDYSTGSDSAAELKISITLNQPIGDPDTEQKLLNAFEPLYANSVQHGLSLAISRGLASGMSGNAGANYLENGQLRFWFMVKLPLVKAATGDIRNISKLNGKRLLIYQPPRPIEDEYRYTLETWGLIVDIFYDRDAAIAAIKQAKDSSNQFDLIIIYTRVDNLEGLDVARAIAMKFFDLGTPQLLFITESQSKLPAVKKLCEQIPSIDLLLKPVSYKQLRHRLKQHLINGDQEVLSQTKEDFLNGKKILLLQKEDIDLTIAEVMLTKLGCEVRTATSTEEALKLAKEIAFDAFITENHLANKQMATFVEKIKTHNGSLHKDGYVIPVIGLTHSERDGEETRCLQCGMNYYVDPPLEFDNLRAILRRWIGRAVHMAEASQTIN
jgi:CheY-like chemotaxis protein/signal transduction histidine kinase